MSIKSIVDRERKRRLFKEHRFQLNMQRLISFFKKRFYLFIFRERGGEGERAGNMHVWLLLMLPLLGTSSTTQACTLTGNQTGNPLVHTKIEAGTQSTEPHQLGQAYFFKKRKRQKRSLCLSNLNNIYKQSLFYSIFSHVLNFINKKLNSSLAGVAQ